MSRLLALLGVIFCSCLASAQVIYQPVRFEYGAGPAHFYYGGSDPAVIARGLADIDGRCGLSGYSPNAPALIYCDEMPGQNARLYGLTPADAQNEAYDKVPRYFRKGNLLGSAVPQADGTLLVPAQARPVRTMASIVITRPRPRPAVTRPSAEPTPPTRPMILIIPKDMMDRPVIPQPQGGSI